MWMPVEVVIHTGIAEVRPVVELAVPGHVDQTVLMVPGGRPC